MTPPPLQGQQDPQEGLLNAMLQGGFHTGATDYNQFAPAAQALARMIAAKKAQIIPGSMNQYSGASSGGVGPAGIW